MNPEIRQRLVALNLIEGFGPAALKKAIERFGSVEDFPKNFVPADKLAMADKEILEAQNKKISIVTFLDNEYPEALRHIHNPPIALYIKGSANCLKEQLAVGIVGSRRATFYGQKMATQIAEDLASNGVVIVSGLAQGIDTASHKGALKAKEGVTIAVLAGGLNDIFPKENTGLAQKITERGALVSEYPLSRPTLKGQFPARNRIIAGLSRGVLLVEAKEKSGALITATLALEEGRDVFAVPGNADSALSRGTNQLIKEGAGLVTCAADILTEWGFDAQSISSNKKIFAKLNSEQNRIVSFLSSEPVHVEELIEQCGWTSQKVSGVLTDLELKGLVKQLPGKNFVKL